MSKTISVCIPKGGVGKTTTAVNLSASLAVAEKKTLLIDADPFGASAIALGYTPDKIKGGLAEIFGFTHSIKSVIHRTDLEYLDFVPSNIYSINMHDRFIKYAENRSILKNSLTPIENYYDFIIIDCPPILKGITTNALVASDSILIPIKSGHFSLEAIDTLFKYFEHIKEIANPDLEIEGIILTMYEKDSKVTKISERELKIKYNKYLLNTFIPNTSLLNESTFYGKPLCLYKIDSEGAIAYLDLASEILNNNLKDRKEIV